MLRLEGGDCFSLAFRHECNFTCLALKVLDAGYLEVSGVEDFTECFRGCSSLFNLIGLDTQSASSACATTQSMFNGCTRLAALDLG